MQRDVDFEAFFKMNERRIHYQIHRLGIKGDHYEEFYSEGIVALWQAYQSFDAAKGNAGTFFNYQIRHRLQDLLRKKWREKDIALEIKHGETTKMDAGNRHRGSGLPVVLEQGIELGDSRFWEEVQRLLTVNQWKWVQYFIIADLSVREIMELENVSADAVKGWGRAVRRKLRDKKVWRRLKELL